MEIQILTLEEAPQYLSQVIGLIETEFGYSKEFHFEIDFYPLVSKDNHKNCYLLINKETQELIGHIGVLVKKIEINDISFHIPLIGGIAISEIYRGKGYFRNFFNSVISKYPSAPLMLLWSDKEQLFNRFDFHAAGKVYEFAAGTEKKVLESKIASLTDFSESEFKELSKIFNKDQKWRTPLRRKKSDWSTFTNITSTEFRLYYSDKEIVGYTFTGKGQDLTNIIHEYSCLKDNKKDFLKSLEECLIWTPEKLDLPLNRVLSFGLVRINQGSTWTQFTEAWFHENKQELKGRTAKDTLDIILSNSKANPRGALWVSGLESI